MKLHFLNCFMEDPLASKTDQLWQFFNLKCLKSFLYSHSTRLVNGVFML